MHWHVRLCSCKVDRVCKPVTFRCIIKWIDYRVSCIKPNNARIWHVYRNRIVVFIVHSRFWKDAYHITQDPVIHVPSTWYYFHWHSLHLQFNKMPRLQSLKGELWVQISMDFYDIRRFIEHAFDWLRIMAFEWAWDTSV